MKSVGSILAASLGLVALTGACTDSRIPTEVPVSRTMTPLTASGRGLLNRYVAIGTSVTMGVQSDGVFAGSQRDSWAVQLAALAGQEMSLPLISGYGCGSPLTSPLVTFGRTRPAPLK